MFWTLWKRYAERRFLEAGPGYYPIGTHFLLQYATIVVIYSMITMAISHATHMEERYVHVLLFVLAINGILYVTTHSMIDCRGKGNFNMTAGKSPPFTEGMNMTAGKSPPFTEGMKGACPQRGQAKDANYCGETLANR